MSKKTSDVVACVVDHGLFLPVAQKLGEQFKKVYYYTPIEKAMPLLSDAVVGDGFETVERIYCPWEVKDRCDLFVFPDIGFGGMQKELRAQGYPVWGHMGADILETHRGRFLGKLEELGLDVPPHQVVVGMTALKDYLRYAEDVYIKISRWRGDWETFHWRSWEEDESTLDYSSFRLGPMKERMTFYVFDAIDTDIEDGIDTWCIDGKWPKLVMHGMERKDKSYLCGIQEMDTIALAVSIVNQKIGPELAQYGYRGFFSSEVRIKDEFSYFIDPTCRAGSPPSQVMTELIENLGEVVWQGAQGICVDPVPKAKFGAQVAIMADRKKGDWLSLDLGPDVKPWVKSGDSCEVNDVVFVPPNPTEPLVGWVTAIGDTLEETIGNIQIMVKNLPCGLECDVSSMAALLSEMEEAKKEGVEIAEEIPDPATVLEEA